MAQGPAPAQNTAGRDRGSLGREAGRENRGTPWAVRRRLGARCGPGSGVWLERDVQVVTWAHSYEPKGPAVARPASQPLTPGWASGRGAAQAAARPGGAQSPALTQLNAGAAAAPPWGAGSRQRSPAEVIMVAPCPRRSAPPPSWPSPRSVSSGPARSAAPPGSRVRCSVSPCHRPPARF